MQKNKIFVLAFFLVGSILWLFSMPVIREHGTSFSLFTRGAMIDRKYTIVELLSGNDFYGAVGLILSILAPALFLVFAIIIKRPFPTFTKVMMILFGVANLFLPLLILFYLTFTVLGPHKQMIGAGLVLLFLQFISGILFILAGSKASIFGNLFQEME